MFSRHDWQQRENDPALGPWNWENFRRQTEQFVGQRMVREGNWATQQTLHRRHRCTKVFKRWQWYQLYVHLDRRDWLEIVRVCRRVQESTRVLRRKNLWIQCADEWKIGPGVFQVSCTTHFAHFSYHLPGKRKCNVGRRGWQWKAVAVQNFSLHLSEQDFYARNGQRVQHRILQDGFAKDCSLFRRRLIKTLFLVCWHANCLWRILGKYQQHAEHRWGAKPFQEERRNWRYHQQSATKRIKEKESGQSVITVVILHIKHPRQPAHHLVYEPSRRRIAHPSAKVSVLGQLLYHRLVRQLDGRSLAVSLTKNAQRDATRIKPQVQF